CGVPTPQGTRQSQCDESMRHILPRLDGIDRLARQPTAYRQGLLAQARFLPPPSKTIVQCYTPRTSGHAEFLRETLYRIAVCLSIIMDASHRLQCGISI